MTITFVWIQDERGTIAKDGEIPFSMPADLKFFKDTTMTGNILMGRKTFEALPNGALPDRENLILTRQTDYTPEDAQVFHSKAAVLAYASKQTVPLHVIGGAEIFSLFLDEVDYLYETRVHDYFAGDTFMPTIDYSQFVLISEKEGEVDEKNSYPYTFLIYKRI